MNALAADAYVLATEAVAQLAHSGGCPGHTRTTPCGLDEEWWCVQPTFELQRSMPVDLAGGDAAQKEKIAVQCEAGWPCESSAR